MGFELPFDAATWLVAGLGVLVAYVMHGITGFGAPLIAVPVLAHFMPMQQVVPLQSAQDLIAAAVIGQKARREFARAEFVWLAIPMLAGMIAGAWLLVSLPQRTMLLALAVFSILYGLVGLFGRAKVPSLPRAAAVPFGMVGGVFSTLFGAGGPIYVMYMANRITDAAALRATIIVFALTSAVLRVAVFGVAGLLTDAKLWLAIACLLPFLVVGVKLGAYLHTKLSGRVNRSLVYAMLVAGGASLLARHW